jgi:hypothetical protein
MNVYLIVLYFVYNTGGIGVSHQAGNDMLGYYSQQSVDLGHPFHIYKTPTDMWVRCTCVSSGPIAPDWPDYICMGEVTEYVSTIQGNERWDLTGKKD